MRTKDREVFEFVTAAEGPMTAAEIGAQLYQSGPNSVSPALTRLAKQGHIGTSKVSKRHPTYYFRVVGNCSAQLTQMLVDVLTYIRNNPGASVAEISGGTVWSEDAVQSAVDKYAADGVIVRDAVSGRWRFYRSVVVPDTCIIQALRTNGPMTCFDLERMLGSTASAVQTQLDALIDNGIVKAKYWDESPTTFALATSDEVVDVGYVSGVSGMLGATMLELDKRAGQTSIKCKGREYDGTEWTADYSRECNGKTSRFCATTER